MYCDKGYVWVLFGICLLLLGCPNDKSGASGASKAHDPVETPAVIRDGPFTISVWLLPTEFSNPSATALMDDDGLSISVMRAARHPLPEIPVILIALSASQNGFQIL